MRFQDSTFGSRIPFLAAHHRARNHPLCLQRERFEHDWSKWSDGHRRRQTGIRRVPCLYRGGVLIGINPKTCGALRSACIC